MLRRTRRARVDITTEPGLQRADRIRHAGDPAQRQREILLRAVARQFYW